MKRRKLILISLALLTGSGIQAQNEGTWSLKDCIDYAIKNNIQLQKSRINQK